ncbi:MAG: hypothetical protein H6712_05430 [Myxococcales bacterium]|nr:hypothetical protein [Myxococcales bacterium]
MKTARPALPLMLALALASACDSGTKDSKPAPVAQAPATTPADDAKAPTPSHGDPSTNPHGAPSPHAAPNPHANMPPMMGAPPKPAGPPREITPSGEVAAETLTGLAFAVPKEWEKGAPSNRMRLAQWVLPGPGGDAELVVFRFPGGAGGIEANLTRWKGQFTPPEGKTIDDVSTTKEVQGEGLKTTLVDVSGTYVAAMTPGAEAKHDDPDTRMLAAIVEGIGDPFYFKAVGPKATMDLWAEPFAAMIGTFAASGGGTGAAASGGGAAGAEAAGGAPAGGAEAKAGDAGADGG